MDFSLLPYWPVAMPGESKQSWMEAVLEGLPIIERDGWEMIAAKRLEPERPDRGEAWRGLPPQLGDIAAVPPAWRVAPHRRHIYCPQCYLDQAGHRRWPVCSAWLDVRQLRCLTHGGLLVYQKPRLGVDEGLRRCADVPEMAALCDWAAQWIRLDRVGIRKARYECHWRRDLVHLICRNWTPARCHSAAGLGAWELTQWGWPREHPGGRLDAGYPGRLGDLPPKERIGGLLLAFRCWQMFRKQPVPIPPLPRAAWIWLAKRWIRRLEGSAREEFTAQSMNLIKHSQ